MVAAAAAQGKGDGAQAGQADEVLAIVQRGLNLPGVPTILEIVPQTPGRQTRNAVTRRITAHVTAGWPHLGEPLVRHRGQYCYVSALLPGHREPTPILRLRYQGSPTTHRDL